MKRSPASSQPPGDWRHKEPAPGFIMLALEKQGKVGGIPNVVSASLLIPALFPDFGLKRAWEAFMKEQKPKAELGLASIIEMMSAWEAKAQPLIQDAIHEWSLRRPKQDWRESMRKSGANQKEDMACSCLGKTMPLLISIAPDEALWSERMALDPKDWPDLGSINEARQETRDFLMRCAKEIAQRGLGHGFEALEEELFSGFACHHADSIEHASGRSVFCVGAPRVSEAQMDEWAPRVKARFEAVKIGKALEEAKRKEKPRAL